MYWLIASLYAAIAILPLVHSPSGFFVFELPQVIWARLLILLTLFYAAILCWRKGVIWLPQSRWLRSGILVWITAALVSAVLAWSPAATWFGSDYRFQGLIYDALNLLLVFSILQLSYQPGLAKARLWWLYSIIAGGVLVSVIGLATKFGWFTLLDQFRMSATFGHPNSLAISLALAGLCVVGLLLYLPLPTSRSKLPSGKRLAVVVAIGLSVYLIEVAMLSTFTRTAWLAQVGGIAVLIGLHAMQKRNWRQAMQRSASIVIIIAMAYVSARAINTDSTAYLRSTLDTLLPFINTTAAANELAINPLDDRLLSIGNTESGSLQVRKHIWQDVETILRDRWLFGVGRDNLHIYYPQYYRYDTTRPLIAYQTYADRAHNDILDSWLQYGAIGVIAKYTLVAYLIWLLFTWLRKTTQADWQQQVIVAVTLSALLTYMVYVQLNFGVVVATTWLCVLVGTALPIILPGQSISLSRPIQRITQAKAIQRFGFAILLIVFVTSTVLQLLVRPTAANYLAGQARLYPADTTALPGLLRAYALDSNSETYALLLAATYAGAASTEPNTRLATEYIDDAIRFTEAARQRGAVELDVLDTQVYVYKAAKSDYSEAKSRTEATIRAHYSNFGKAAR